MVYVLSAISIAFIIKAQTITNANPTLPLTSAPADSASCSPIDSLEVTIADSIAVAVPDSVAIPVPADTIAVAIPDSVAIPVPADTIATIPDSVTIPVPADTIAVAVPDSSEPVPAQPSKRHNPKTVKSEGAYTYIVPEGMSVDRAILTAIDRAKIVAIENAFGTKVGQSTTTVIQASGENSSVDFLSVSETEANGEWVETIGEPESRVEYLNNQLVIQAAVKGYVRELVATHVPLQLKTLRNGTEDRFSSSDFVNDDELFMSFKSPIDGYVAIYLVDYTTKEVYRMLPYRRSSDLAQGISKEKRYVFFSPAHEDPDRRRLVDNYILTTDKPSERNDLLVLFSPTQFSGSGLGDGGSAYMPSAMEWKDFHSWLTKIRRSNPSLQLERLILTIRKE